MFSRMLLCHTLAAKVQVCHATRGAEPDLVVDVTHDMSWTSKDSRILNHSAFAQKNGLILHTTVGIGYETPWRQVEAILLLAAERTPGLLKEPAPFVLQKALSDFCVTYEINVRCDDHQGMARLYTDLHRNILDVFNEYGVQIMTPAYEGDPERPKVVPKEQWFATPAQPPDATSTMMGGE